MNEAFEKIDIEKKDRIINSALKEFAENGYDKASTNNIVKNAGISKGLLFHYFKNKEGLYKFLLDFSLDIILKDFEENFDWNEEDILERIKQAIIVKMKITERYPSILKFSLNIYKHKTQEDIMNMNQGKLIKLFSKFYDEGIDYSKFKDGLDLKKVINIIRWTLEKNSENYIKRVNEREVEFVSNESLLKEIEAIDEYIAIFKNAFYK